MLSCSNLKTQEFWLTQKWGRLRIEPHQPLKKSWGSGLKDSIYFICDFGHKTSKCFSNVCSGKSLVCQECWKPTKETWLMKNWGFLKLDPNQKLPLRFCESKHQFWMLCGNCGSRVKMFLYNLRRNPQDCGQCGSKSKTYWLNEHKWNGTFRLDPNQKLPESWSLNTNARKLKLKFICDCGRNFNSSMNAVIRHTSCGKCEFNSRDYWLQQRWGKLRIDPNQSLPPEWGVGQSSLIKVLCDCGNTHTTKMYHLSSGDVNSCGCRKIGTGLGSEVSDVFFYTKSLSSESVEEFHIPKHLRYRYDIYIPSKKLAIEYHGLIWHSERFRKGRTDHSKLLLAQARGDRLIQIYSDEWRDKQTIMKAMLKSLIQPKAGKRIKPTFEVHLSTPSEARDFLEAHHYLGAASQKASKGVTIIARHGGAVVGVWVFMKREEGTVLWHRASWNHEYRAWNPHEKALALAVPELQRLGFTKMLTFSDNRFHTGKLYEKLSFKFEKELNPDYGYTNGTERKSKYALRVRAGINEVEAAKEKGWYRIWDSGKRRYVLPL